MTPPPQEPGIALEGPPAERLEGQFLGAVLLKIIADLPRRMENHRADD